MATIEMVVNEVEQDDMEEWSSRSSGINLGEMKSRIGVQLIKINENWI